MRQPAEGVGVLGIAFTEASIQCGKGSCARHVSIGLARQLANQGNERLVNVYPAACRAFGGSRRRSDEQCLTRWLIRRSLQLIFVEIFKRILSNTLVSARDLFKVMVTPSSWQAAPRGRVVVLSLRSHGRTLYGGPCADNNRRL